MKLSALLSAAGLLVTGVLACEQGKGGTDCSCDLNTDALQGAKSSTLVVGDSATRVNAGDLILRFEQSAMYQQEEMTLGLEDLSRSEACAALFQWTIPPQDCTTTIAEGTANFADVIATCMPSSEDVTDDNLDYTELTFHFTVENKRDVKIADTWKLQTSKVYMPVQVKLQKTFTTETSEITVEEVSVTFLRIEFSDDASPIDDAALITLVAGALGDDVEEADIAINKIGSNVVVRVSLDPEDDADALETAAEAVQFTPTFSNLQVEAITSIIAPSGVLKVATARVDQGGVAELTVELYAQAGYPYKMTFESTELPTGITSSDDWAPLEDSATVCGEVGEPCGDTFELNAVADSDVDTFTGVYKVKFAISCVADFDPTRCAVLGRGVTASLLFTIETGDHSAQLLDDVTLNGELAVTALEYGSAQEMSAFLNNEFVYVVASVYSDQAELTYAKVISVSMNDDDELLASSLSLYNNGLTPDGAGVGFETTAASLDANPNVNVAGQPLEPMFKFKTNMTVINKLNAEGNFYLDVTLEVEYEGLSQSFRRLLNVRALLADTMETRLEQTRTSMQLESGPLSAGLAATVKVVANAGSSATPGMWAAALLCVLSLALN